jgi:hypothetical protein
MILKNKDNILLEAAYEAVQQNKQEDFNSKRVANQILIKLQNRGFQNSLGAMDSGGFMAGDGNNIEFYHHKDGEQFIALCFTPSMKFVKGVYAEDHSGHIAKYFKTVQNAAEGIDEIANQMKEMVGKEDYGHVEMIDSLPRLMEILA